MVLRRGRVLLVSAALVVSSGISLAPVPASALTCPGKDPSGSIECVNAGTSWCGNTCKSEPSCSGTQYVKSYFTAAQCVPCSCACQPSQVDCTGSPTVCQDHNPTCASQYKTEVCSVGTQTDCGACISGYTMCGSTCLPSASPSCIPPAVYNPCTSTCTHPYILVSPSSTQPATIDISGNIKLGGELKMTDGKAIRVDSPSAGTVLNIGNWGGAAATPNFTAAVKGKLEIEGMFQAGYSSPPAVSIGAPLDPDRNLFYGDMAAGSVGNLILFQRPSGSSKFQVDADGNIIIGTIPSATLSTTMPLNMFATSDAAGKIIVTDATRHAAYVDMSGAATIVPSGALTLGPQQFFPVSMTTPEIRRAGRLALETVATGGADDLVFRTAGNTQMQVYESGGVGLGNGSLVLGASGNLVYGNISAASAGGAALLRLQSATIDKFVVDTSGRLTAGSVPWGAVSSTAPTVACSGNDFVKSFDGSTFTCSSMPPSPAGVNYQTLRSDGVDWVASSALLNDGNAVGINVAPPISPAGLRLEVQEVIQASSGTAANYASLQSRADNGVLASIRSRGSTSAGALFGLPNSNLVSVSDLGTAISPNNMALGSVSGAPLILGANNAEALRISGSGNVGLGTAAPAVADNLGLPVKLDVRGGVSLGNNSSVSFLPNGSSITYQVMRLSSGNQLSLCDSSAWSGCRFLAGAPGNVVAVMGATGMQIGYGSSNPAYRLEAFANTPWLAGVLHLGNLAAPGNGTGARALFSGRSSTATNINVAGLAGVMTDGTAGAYSGALPLSASSNGSLFEAARFSQAGNFGLGTTVPGAQMHVYSNSASVNAEMAFQSGNGATVQSAWKAYQDRSNGDLAFKQSNITSNGGVGLALKADAGGTVQISTLQVTAGAGVADYVLSSDSQGVGSWKQLSRIPTDYCLASKYAGKTVTGYTGNIGSYTSASAACSAALGGAPSHICTPEEIVRTVDCMRQAGAGYTATYGAPVLPTDGSVAWLAAGPSGFTAPSANDCFGFTSASTSVYGRMWVAVGDGYSASTACDVAKPIICCR